MISFIISACNSFIGGLGDVLKALTSILPPSPFTVLDNSVIAEYLPTLNWFIPIGPIVTILETWLLAYASYMIYQIVLRWIKAID